jgi:RIO-like serine/threonine protein kinase
MATGTCLKRGNLGDVVLDTTGPHALIVREFAAARPGWRWLARRLGQREAQALDAIRAIDGVPRLHRLERSRLTRSFVAGQPMHRAEPRNAAYFADARQLLQRLHAAGLVHNDLAKEANWIVRPDGRAGIVDFQLALRFVRRGRLFRLLAREDLRHLLKHKARYCPVQLTAAERQLLASPSAGARGWRRFVKPPYRFLTRRVFGWPERYSADERQRSG